MTDIHLDTLFERAQRGELSAEDEARLLVHTRRCAGCAVERHLWLESLEQSDDEALLDRMVQGAMEALEDERPAPAFRRRRTPRWAYAAAALLVFVLGGGASALVWRAVAAPEALPSADEAVSAPSTGPGHPAPMAARMAEEPVLDLEPIEIEPQRRESERLGPDALLARANGARRRDVAQAVRLYRRLQRAYPSSAHATTSHVSLGRLLMDRLDDPGGALRHFDAYLVRRPSGSLAPEALLGRARSLERLGRRRAAREAWQALLERFPDGIHAQRARAHLERNSSPRMR